MGKLKRRLVLHHPLAHGRRVRVADRDHLDEGVVALPRTRHRRVRLVVVGLRGEVGNDRFQEFQLLFHRVVHPRLHRRHDLELALQQRQHGAHRGLRGHVRDLEVCCGGEPPRLVHDAAQQRQERLGRLLVGQGHDVVAHRAGGHVDVPELARGDGGIVPFDSKATGLQSPWKV